MVAIIFAVALTVTPTSALSTRVERFFADVALLADPSADVGWVMGGTFDPDPVAAGYYGTVIDGILQRSVPGGVTEVAPLWTPEQVWPLFGDLTFGESVDQDAAILQTAILDGGGTLRQIPGYPLPGPLGDQTGVVFGYSQSATAATKAMPALHDALDNPGNLRFLLAGNPNNPLGGILTRFDFPDSPITGAARALPLLNIPLGIGPTPTDLFPTDIYTAEYDGWANFPQDPTNLLADVNALAGILTVHSVYKDLPADAALVNLGQAGSTTFYMIPTKELPILWPLYQLGEPGKVLASALEPGLRLGINWGYGNPGMAFHGVGADGIGPWAVNALGELSAIQSGQFVEGSGLAGFLPMMDPLQMLIGIQEAGVHSFLNPVEEILDVAGLGTVPDWFTDALHLPTVLTGWLDEWVMTGWNNLIGSLDLAALLGTGLLWEDIFDGLPLISGAPVMAGVGLVFDLLNLFGA
ncbi:PE-PPE domain-containing protein [Mycobacterium sp. 1274756.6]|uniref:PE-PPE domain-containing protein n=1 Tax=Mycobacterium sp. 1274756.6 TaxID=1834076 RepID=UPI000B19A303|nr:PE-PPE domain-containing protein [Mycobacterium sp. 1274756.6]